MCIMNCVQFRTIRNQWCCMTEEIKAIEKRKPGRPKTLKDSKPSFVYLDAETLAIASRLGKGNVSAGIRIALKTANSVWDCSV